jgi:hypothetical protein
MRPTPFKRSCAVWRQTDQATVSVAQNLEDYPNSRAILLQMGYIRFLRWDASAWAGNASPEPMREIRWSKWSTLHSI